MIFSVIDLIQQEGGGKIYIITGVTVYMLSVDKIICEVKVRHTPIFSIFVKAIYLAEARRVRNSSTVLYGCFETGSKYL
jgi:hypothetical protein